MCNRKCPGVYLRSFSDLEFDEYIWAIHEYIDLVTETTRMKRDIYNSTGIPATLISNSPFPGFKGSAYISTGYVYAPYIPLYSTPISSSVYLADDGKDLNDKKCGPFKKIINKWRI